MSVHLPPPELESSARRRVLRPFGAYEHIADPFPRVVAESCLPVDQYQELARTFPRLECFAPDGASLNHRVLRLSSSRVLAEPAFGEAWHWFVEHHTNQAFWLQILNVFGSSLHHRFAELEARIGRPMDKWKAVRRGSGEKGDVFLECQLVVNTPASTSPTSVKGPHVDHVSKLWTGLLYMRDPQDDTPGGDLELYRGEAGLRFDAHQAPRSAVVKESQLRYATNAFIGFVNGPRAIHAVSPRAPSSHVRRYVDFVVEMDQPTFALPQMNPIQRKWFRLRHRQRSR